MKISVSKSLRAIICLALCASTTVRASLPANDNPTGSAGVFNGNSATGCSYDPYTANATRTIPDLTVAGAVGAYPLQWARTMNSRGAGLGLFGAGGSWRHSYQWSCTAEDSLISTPSIYHVAYPDGRNVTFTSDGVTGWRGPLGVTDRFQGVAGSNDCYLLLADGGQVHFPQTSTHVPADPPPNYYFTFGPPSAIIDPNGLSTTLTYDPTSAA